MLAAFESLNCFASSTNDPEYMEMDDEFGDYMEQQLMQEADSMGIFDPK